MGCGRMKVCEASSPFVQDVLGGACRRHQERCMRDGGTASLPLLLWNSRHLLVHGRLVATLVLLLLLLSLCCRVVVCRGACNRSKQGVQSGGMV